MNTNKHKEIIELLKKTYLSEKEGVLKNKVGGIVQDHIARGFYNSTMCLSKQLQAHYDHIDNLIDYIIESLKSDFANIPLEQCRETLLTIVDEEYKKLIPFANAFLVKTGLASQNNLSNFEQGVNNRKGKAKQAIETEFVIIENQRLATAKPWYKKAWPYIAGAIVIVAALLTIIRNSVELKKWFFPSK